MGMGTGYKLQVLNTRRTRVLGKDTKSGASGTGLESVGGLPVRTFSKF